MRLRYIKAMDCTAHRIVLDDHARLPWRFFGRLRAALRHCCA